jgi:ribulose 1,5-bisphosphate synthetase/thiazole synthase
MSHATAEASPDVADADVIVVGAGPVGLATALAAAGHVAALVRPDHYLFGGVASTAELPGLIDDLRRQLTGVPLS